MKDVYSMEINQMATQMTGDLNNEWDFLQDFSDVKEVVEKNGFEEEMRKNKQQWGEEISKIESYKIEMIMYEDTSAIKKVIVNALIERDTNCYERNSYNIQRRKNTIANLKERLKKQQEINLLKDDENKIKLQIYNLRHSYLEVKTPQKKTSQEEAWRFHLKKASETYYKILNNNLKKTSISKQYIHLYISVKEKHYMMCNISQEADEFKCAMEKNNKLYTSYMSNKISIYEKLLQVVKKEYEIKIDYLCTKLNLKTKENEELKIKIDDFDKLNKIQEEQEKELLKLDVEIEMQSNILKENETNLEEIKSKQENIKLLQKEIEVIRIQSQNRNRH
jgi:hypothetical protein